MLKRELDNRVGVAALAAALVLIVLGLAAHTSFRHKRQVADIVAQREWQQNREAGLPESMEPGENASPEDRKAARRFALEQKQWNGASPVEADPNAAPADAPVSTPTSPAPPPPAPPAPMQPVATVSAPVTPAAQAAPEAPTPAAPSMP